MNVTKMWANAQRDGHPAEYRWRPLFNAAKFGWRPVLECRAVTLPRRETRWNLQGCPKLPDRSQPLVHHIIRICGGDICLISFSDCRYVPQMQSCAIVPRCQIFDDFLRTVFATSRVQHVSDLRLKFALRPHHVWKYCRHPICDGWD